MTKQQKAKSQKTVIVQQVFITPLHEGKGCEMCKHYRKEGKLK